MEDLRGLLLLGKRTGVNRRLLGAAGSVGAQRATRASVAEALCTKELSEAGLAVAVLTVNTVLGNLELTVAVLAVYHKEKRIKVMNNYVRTTTRENETGTNHLKQSLW